jgi:16S rRNA (cytosine967-C5)-methyltransferase
MAAAYETGLVEIQDAASQIAVAALEIPDGATVLDYCAGGGGKALAITDRFNCQVSAYDIAEQRTKDIAPRAERAGVLIEVVTTEALNPDAGYDIVVVDAPCSGSGTWRRNPEAKWGFTQDNLNEFSALQSEVIVAASAFVRPAGVLYYMTCSVLSDENDQVVQRFVDDNAGWTVEPILRLLPSDASDGFFLCKLTKSG